MSELRLTAAGMTHLGRVREVNEDCIGIAGWMRARSMRAPTSFSCLVDEPTLCVIADGMGGHVGGEVASALAVREMLSAVHTIERLSDIAEIIGTVNLKLFETVRNRPELSGMGATIVGAVVACEEVCLFNLGDCRAYVQEGPYLQLCSQDDTRLFQEGISSGRTGTRGHGVTQCLGGSSNVIAISPHLSIRAIDSELRVLLCSDGLTDMLDQDTIEGCLAKETVLTVQNLVKAAIDAGGTDNISVCYLELSVC